MARKPASVPVTPEPSSATPPNSPALGVVQGQAGVAEAEAEAGDNLAPSNQEPMSKGFHDGPPAARQADTLDYSKGKDPGNVERGSDTRTFSAPHLDPTESAWQVAHVELPRSRPQGLKGSQAPTEIRIPIAPEDHQPDRESLDYRAGEAAGFTAGIKRAQGQG